MSWSDVGVLAALGALTAGCGATGAEQATDTVPIAPSTTLESSGAGTTPSSTAPIAPPVTAESTDMGTTPSTTADGPDIAGGQPCVPGPDPSVIADPSIPSNLYGEALVEHLSGVDELTIPEGVDVRYDEPNFGGVWGDGAGGWVVAVLDCTKVDANRIAELAGGAALLHLIEVPYTFEQVNEFSDRLIDELDVARVRGDVFIDSTLHGRRVRVIVEDPAVLPVDFGASVPSGVFVVEQGELVRPLAEEPNE